MNDEPMTELWYTETTKDQLLDELAIALKSELTAKTDAASAASWAEIVQARTLKIAYEDGKIEGKNQAERDRAETVYLAEHDGYQGALRIAKREEYAAALATIQRKLAEENISLTRAAWYGPMRAVDGGETRTDG